MTPTEYLDAHLCDRVRLRKEPDEEEEEEDEEEGDGQASGDRLVDSALHHRRRSRGPILRHSVFCRVYLRRTSSDSRRLFSAANFPGFWE